MQLHFNLVIKKDQVGHSVRSRPSLNSSLRNVPNPNSALGSHSLWMSKISPLAPCSNQCEPEGGGFCSSELGLFQDCFQFWNNPELGLFQMERLPSRALVRVNAQMYSSRVHVIQFCFGRWRRTHLSGTLDYLLFDVFDLLKVLTYIKVIDK